MTGCAAPTIGRAVRSPAARRPCGGGGNATHGERMRCLRWGDPTLENVSSGRAARWSWTQRFDSTVDNALWTSGQKWVNRCDRAEAGPVLIIIVQHNSCSEYLRPLIKKKLTLFFGPSIQPLSQTQSFLCSARAHHTFRGRWGTCTTTPPCRSPSSHHGSSCVVEHDARKGLCRRLESYWKGKIRKKKY
jgi:hypothetical protein